MAFDLGKNGVIPAKANACARVPFGAMLANENITRNDVLATIFLDAKAFASTIATVATGAARFFMSNFKIPFLAPRLLS